MIALRNDTNLLPLIVAERGGAALFSSFVNTAGLFAYSIVIYVLIKYRNQFNNPFYTLVLALAFPDCLTGTLELIYAIPARLIDERRFPVWYHDFIGCISVCSYFMLESITLVISFNRLIAVVFFTSYSRLFTPTRLAIVIVSCYAYGIGVTSLMYGCECKVGFPDYAWLFDCNFNGTCAAVALRVNQVLSDAVLALMIVFYIIVFVQVRRISGRIAADNSGSQQRRKEIQLFFQFAAISCVLIAYEVSFWIIPPLMEQGWFSATTGSIIINTCCNINSYISPFLYLLFSSEIRHKMFTAHKINIRKSVTAHPNGANSIPNPLNE